MPTERTPHSATTRRLFIAVLLTLLAVVAAGCGGDDDAADATTTTTADAATTTTATGGDGTATSAPDPSAAPTTAGAPNDEAFAAALADMNAKLDAAGDDFCKIAQSASSTSGAATPTTPDQVRGMYDYYRRTFERIADTLPSTSGEGADDAQVLRAAAAKMIADAEANNYDPKQFSTTGPPAAFNEPAPLAAIQRLSTRINKECSPEGASGPS